MNLKMVFGVIGGFFLFALVAGIAVVVSQRPPSVLIPKQIGLPVANGIPETSSSTAATIALPLTGGGTLAVKDFIHNGETVADMNTPGSYVLAGSLGYCLSDGTCPHGATSTQFAISYTAQTQSFNIMLLKAPLGVARKAAEQFLVNRLGVAGQKLCELHYFIGTSYQVSTTYTAKNLGFSFCPGATALP